MSDEIEQDSAGSLAEHMKGLGFSRDQRQVSAALVELAVLRGLLNRSLMDLEIGEVARTIDRIRELLRDALLGGER